MIMKTTILKVFLFLSTIFLGIGIILVFFSEGASPQLVQKDVGERGGITLAFPVEMNRESVEERLVVSPGDNFIWLWEDNDLTIWAKSTWEAGTTIKIDLYPGAKTIHGGAILFQKQFEVEVREAEVIFLRSNLEDEGIWKWNQQSNQTEIVYQIPGIQEISVSTDGEWIVASQENTEGGKDLKLYSRDGKTAENLVDCGKNDCGEMTWEPYRQRIAYSHYNKNNIQSPTIWIYDLNSGENTPFIKAGDIHGQFPGFSVQGTYFTLFSPDLGGIFLLNLKTGKSDIIQSSIPQEVTWLPDESAFFFMETFELDGQPVDKILQYDVVRQEANLAFGSVDDIFNYGKLAWSPNNLLAAIPIRQVNGGLSSQIWLFYGYGEFLQEITRDPSATHGGLNWSPYGKYLLIQSYSMNSSGQATNLYIWNSESGELKLVDHNVFGGKWLP